VGRAELPVHSPALPCELALVAPNMPVYYLCSDDRTITLCDHAGASGWWVTALAWAFPSRMKG